MILNNKMKKLVDKLNIIDELIANIELMEFTKMLFPQYTELSNVYNEKYYLLDDNFITNKTGKELSWVEWDTNEKRIVVEDNSIVKVTKVGLIVTKVWAQSLKEKYPNKEFDVILSIDEGEIDCIPPSATLRFYLVREGYHCCSNIEKFEQPILIQSTSM